jgi:hypothetical protein
VAKNQNTFEKRRREVDKKRKAAEKNERRRKKKEQPDAKAALDPREAEEDGAMSS